MQVAVLKQKWHCQPQQSAQMKRLRVNDSDVLEEVGWQDMTMLRRYTAAFASELVLAAHVGIQSRRCIVMAARVAGWSK